MYYQDRSREITGQGGAGGTKLSQVIAQTWRKLPLSEKQPYFDRVAADKKRYS